MVITFVIDNGLAFYKYAQLGFVSSALIMNPIGGSAGTSTSAIRLAQFTCQLSTDNLSSSILIFIALSITHSFCVHCCGTDVGILSV